MRIAPDTNVLLRIVTTDDPVQCAVARRVLDSADVIAIGHSCLCELAWVLKRSYMANRSDIANAIRLLADGERVVVDRLAAEEGLRLLEAGGDFADGVIAYEGRTLGGETFVSFDKRAVALLRADGRAGELLS